MVESLSDDLLKISKSIELQSLEPRSEEEIKNIFENLDMKNKKKPKYKKEKGKSSESEN